MRTCTLCLKDQEDDQFHVQKTSGAIRYTKKCLDCRTRYSKGTRHLRPEHLTDDYVVCYRCKKWCLIGVEIHSNRASNRGVSDHCKECDRGPMRDRGREYDRAIRAWISSTKRDKPCMDCDSIHDPDVLDYHHRDPKTKLFSISQFNKVTKLRSKIQEEMDKCDLLCANCHRYREKARRTT